MKSSLIELMTSAGLSTSTTDTASLTTLTDVAVSKTLNSESSTIFTNTDFLLLQNTVLLCNRGLNYRVARWPVVYCQFSKGAVF